MQKIIVIIMAIFSYSASAKILLFQLELTPQLKEKTVAGIATIKTENQLSFIFDTNSIIVDKIFLNGKSISSNSSENQTKIELTKKRKNNLIIRYHSSAKNGLVFGENYIYSNYSTCDWMPCEDVSGTKFPVKLKLNLPADFKIVKSDEGFPSSAYLIGFAAGKFYEVTEMTVSSKLTYLGVIDKEDELKKKFQITPEVLKFFEDKSGVTLPGGHYTQVLVPEAEAQEKSSFSLIGKPFLDSILNDPKEDWVIVHELAHQWWGNSITCKSWDHFWLNEGLTVFMTAAYKQQKWGEDAYQREMELAKKRYQKAIDAKLDVPLTFNGKYPSLQIKRAIVYSKGALFLDALRKEIGDVLFWKALRDYTMSFQGKTVESKDFQMSFEKSSRKNLTDIFNKWVY
jgi:aminopeptidase N